MRKKNYHKNLTLKRKVSTIAIAIIFLFLSGDKILGSEILNDNQPEEEQTILNIKKEIEENDEYILNCIENQKEIEKIKEIQRIEEEMKKKEEEEKRKKEEEILKIANRGKINKKDFFNGDKENIKKIIWQIAEEQDLPVGYLYGIAMIETGGTLNPNLEGSNGKSGKPQGLMQIIPSTQRFLGVKNPFDPYQSVLGAAKYLKIIMDEYSGQVIKDQNGNAMDIRMIAVIGYNAGPPKIKSHLKKYGYINIPMLPKETQRYLIKLEEYY